MLVNEWLDLKGGLGGPPFHGWCCALIHRRLHTLELLQDFVWTFCCRPLKNSPAKTYKQLILSSRVSLDPSLRSILNTWWQVRRNFCSSRNTLIMWWQVCPLACFPKRYILIMLWQVHQIFLFPKDPPSSALDDRSTRIFCCSSSSTLITWC